MAAAASPELPVVAVRAASSRLCAHELEAQAVQLYRAQSAGLFRYAVALTRDPALAEDAIQETFLRYFVTCKEGRAIANPRAWLYHVLHNLLMDDRKRLGIRASTGLEAVVTHADRRHDPEERLHREELSGELRESLSGRELECLQLRIEGLGYREIADVLKIRPGTVGALLTRALKKTKSVLKRRGTVL